MENKTRYTLGKEERLKSRKAIEQLFKTGKSFAHFPFRILYQLQPDIPPAANEKLSVKQPGLQAGFSVSSRQFKKAVNRNRVKRLMREAYRLQKNGLEISPGLKDHTLVIFFIYTGKELPEYDLVYEKMKLVLKKLIKLTGENK